MNLQILRILSFIFTLFISTYSFTQTTLIPDVNFEQKLIDLGFDSNGLNGNILNVDAAAVTNLDVTNSSISSLSGIEVFTAMTELLCINNQLTTLDLSQNLALTILNCGANQLTDLNISQNLALEQLFCNSNQLTDLDLSLYTSLGLMNCEDNNLVSLDMRNINLANMQFFIATLNPDLACISVDDPSMVPATISDNVDAGVVFNTDCSTSSIAGINQSNIKLQPNPTIGIIQLENINDYDIYVYNSIGQLILNLENPGKTIDISQLNSGVYTFIFKSETNYFFSKVIKE